MISGSLICSIEICLLLGIKVDILGSGGCNIGGGMELGGILIG